MGPAVQYRNFPGIFNSTRAEKTPKMKIIKAPNQWTLEIPNFPHCFLYTCRVLFHNSAFWRNCLVLPGLSSPRRNSQFNPGGPSCRAGHLPGRAGEALTDLLENSNLPWWHSNSHSLLNLNGDPFIFLTENFAVLEIALITKLCWAEMFSSRIPESVSG